jgi:hypothetical protein
MSMLGPFLNRRSDLSIRNEVVLFRQLIRPVMDYVCSAWRPAARTNVWRLQVLKFKCLRLATGASRYVTSRQIHEDLCVPLFAYHISALTANDVVLPLPAISSTVASPAANQLSQQAHQHLAASPYRGPLTNTPTQHTNL